MTGIIAGFFIFTPLTYNLPIMEFEHVLEKYSFERRISHPRIELSLIENQFKIKLAKGEKREIGDGLLTREETTNETAYNSQPQNGFILFCYKGIRYAEN